MVARAVRGQSSIEFALAIIMVLVMFIGTVKVWSWLNRSLVWRQRAYDETRTWRRFVDEPGKNLNYYQPEPMLEP